MRAPGWRGLSQSPRGFQTLTRMLLVITQRGERGNNPQQIALTQALSQSPSICLVGECYSTLNACADLFRRASEGREQERSPLPWLPCDRHHKWFMLCVWLHFLGFLCLTHAMKITRYFGSHHDGYRQIAVIVLQRQRGYYTLAQIRLRNQLAFSGRVLLTQQELNPHSPGGGRGQAEDTVLLTVTKYMLQSIGYFSHTHNWKKKKKVPEKLRCIPLFTHLFWSTWVKKKKI